MAVMDKRAKDAGLDAVAIVLAMIEGRGADVTAVCEANARDAGPLIGALGAVARDLVLDSGEDPQAWAERCREAVLKLP
jgi:hypothetical protein